MNIKNLFPKTRPKQINATLRRASLPASEDYDTDEPNVRLSRAFLVVMLLHIVAVGGIFAFSSLKKNTPPPLENTSVETPPASVEPHAEGRLYVVSATDTLGSIASTFGLARNDLEKANNLTTSSRIQPGDKLIIPAKSTTKPLPLEVQKMLHSSSTPRVAPALPVQAAPPVTASVKTVKPAEPVVPATSSDSKTYIVQKGDNPVLIAKKHGIKYIDLVEANHITDPKKLQIGQKLIIPQK